MNIEKIPDPQGFPQLYGAYKENDTISVALGLPGIEVTTGKIVLHNDHSLTLYTDFSSGYAMVDFSNEGYTAKFEKEENEAISLCVVKETKCYLYLPRSSSTTNTNSFSTPYFTIQLFQDKR